jgi:hypothetical protein
MLQGVSRELNKFTWWPCRIGSLLYTVHRSTNYDLVTLQPGSSYMASGASDWESRFIEVGQSFLDVLLDPRALRWMMPEMILREVVMWRQLYLAAKPSDVGVHVDGLAYPLHRRIACGCQTRGHSFLSVAALSHHAVVGGGTFSRVRSPRVGYLMECWSSGYLCYRILHGVNHFY